MLRPRCSEMVAEFLGHLKELRNDSSRHAEFFDLYVFSDDTQWRASKPVEPPANSVQQLQAKIAAIVKETDEECDGDCDSGEILNDLVANLRQLSAVQ